MATNITRLNDFLESRDFYELMQSYRHTPVDAALPFEAVKTALLAAIQQTMFCDLQSINEIPRPASLEPYHEWRRDVIPVKTAI